MALLQSWVTSANSNHHPFPLNNLPYGVFSTPNSAPRCGVAIGDMILDMVAVEKSGLIDLGAGALFDVPVWNDVMALGPALWAALRARLTDILAVGSPDQVAAAPLLVAQKDVVQHLPLRVAEYTDFYAGRQHAENMGAILRGGPELPANWLHIPVGYNGRASSIVVSGTPIRRPLGQTKALGATAPSFGPSQRLDIELELGAIVGTASEIGTPITTAQADDMIFGYVLLNDWSARDIQGWEYVPLGPFQGKAFGTSIGAWIVTKEALEPFRAPTPQRVTPLLAYLDEPKDGLYDIDLEVHLLPDGGAKSSCLTQTNYNRMYYSAAQQLTHHAVGGCGMRTGDLLGSGTISGPSQSEFGSMMEMSWAGSQPITLDTGEERSWLEDGDTITLRGHARCTDFTIGFGDCVGKILPARGF